MRSELGKQIAGQVETSQQPTKCVIEKNEKGEKSGNFENIENFSRRRMGKIGTNKERTLAILT